MDWGQFSKDCVQGLQHVFFPQTCAACAEVIASAEGLFCLRCEAGLPETDFHRMPVDAHPVFRRFWGRGQLEGVWCCWHMEGKSGVREVLHALKYRGQPGLARDCGRYYGRILANAGCLQQLDALVFVPMHPKKERKRGFNPAREIAKGLAEAMSAERTQGGSIPVPEGVLKRLSDAEAGLDRTFGRQTGSQTKKDRFERWESVSRLYQAGPEHDRWTGSRFHLGLVDDVLTTGATLEACAGLLVDTGARVTLITLAVSG